MCELYRCGVMADMCELGNGTGGALKDERSVGKWGKLWSHEGGPGSCRKDGQETRLFGFVRVAVLLIRGRSL